jgi:hypothetical protein
MSNVSIRWFEEYGSWIGSSPPHLNNRSVQLCVEALERRDCPSTTWTYTNADSNNSWNDANNWTNNSGGAVTGTPGSGGRTDDIVELGNMGGANANINLDTAAGITIGQLNIRSGYSSEVRLEQPLTITSSSVMDGTGYLWSDNAANTITLTGGTFSVDAGSYMDFGKSAANPTAVVKSTIFLQGGNMSFFNDTNTIFEGYDIKVDTARSSSDTLLFQNTSPIIQWNSAQITIGWDEGSNSTYRSIEDSGTVSVVNSGSFVMDAPIHVTGSGVLTVSASSTVEFAGFTGTKGTSTGTRGESLYMDGGTINLWSGAILIDTYGYQQDNGTLSCNTVGGAATPASWQIFPGTSSTNSADFTMNGGTIQLGDNNADWGYLSIGCGTSQFCWYTGTIALGAANASTLSSIYLQGCDGTIYNVGGNVPAPAMTTLGAAMNAGTYTVIEVPLVLGPGGYSVTAYSTPAPSGATGSVALSGSYDITYP